MEQLQGAPYRGLPTKKRGGGLLKTCPERSEG